MNMKSKNYLLLTLVIISVLIISNMTSAINITKNKTDDDPERRLAVYFVDAGGEAYFSDIPERLNMPFWVVEIQLWKLDPGITDGWVRTLTHNYSATDGYYSVFCFFYPGVFFGNLKVDYNTLGVTDLKGWAFNVYFCKK